MINVTASTTAASEGFATWSDYVLGDASAIPASTTVFVSTDGATASPTSYTDTVPGGQVALVPNRQAKLDALQFAGNGGLDMARNPAGDGLTAQSVPGDLWLTGSPTYVSVVLSTGTGAIGIEPR